MESILDNPFADDSSPKVGANVGRKLGEDIGIVFVGEPVSDEKVTGAPVGDWVAGIKRLDTPERSSKVAPPFAISKSTKFERSTANLKGISTKSETEMSDSFEL